MLKSAALILLVALSLHVASTSASPLKLMSRFSHKNWPHKRHVDNTLTINRLNDDSKNTDTDLYDVKSDASSSSDNFPSLEDFTEDEMEAISEAFFVTFMKIWSTKESKEIDGVIEKAIEDFEKEHPKISEKITQHMLQMMEAMDDSDESSDSKSSKSKESDEVNDLSNLF